MPSAHETLTNDTYYLTLQTRLMLFFYLVTVYGAIAKEIKTLDISHDGIITPPMTCIGGSVDPNLPDERYCPVSGVACLVCTSHANI